MNVNIQTDKLVFQHPGPLPQAIAVMILPVFPAGSLRSFLPRAKDENL